MGRWPALQVKITGAACKNFQRTNDKGWPRVTIKGARPALAIE